MPGLGHGHLRGEIAYRREGAYVSEAARRFRGHLTAALTATQA